MSKAPDKTVNPSSKPLKVPNHNETAKFQNVDGNNLSISEWDKNLMTTEGN